MTKLVKVLFISCFSGVFLLSGCHDQHLSVANNYPVIQKSPNVYAATGYASSVILAKKQALLNAHETCQDSGTHIVSEQLLYHGIINESVLKIADRITKTASSAMSKRPPKIFNRHDYEYHIVFQCISSYRSFDAYYNYNE